MDEAAVQRALGHVRSAQSAIPDAALLAAALARAREQVEALAATTAEIQAGLPDAIQDGLRPSTRHLAEVRGLMNQVISRLERLETDMLAERNARVYDLALVVDLIVSGWRSANERLARIEEKLAEPRRSEAVVYRIERPEQQAG
jgi:hypothetical protein